MRFTEDETAVFLKDVMRLELDQREIQLLEQRTEGWIVGLQLGAFSMQGRQDVSRFVDSFAGSHHFILEYLAE